MVDLIFSVCMIVSTVFCYYIFNGRIVLNKSLYIVMALLLAVGFYTGFNGFILIVGMVLLSFKSKSVNRLPVFRYVFYFLGSLLLLLGFILFIKSLFSF